MLLLNFSHPLTPDQVKGIEAITEQTVERTIEAQTQFDHARLFPEQVRELVDGLGLTSAQWQQEALLINPPALNAIAVTLLAELHGRMGYFPPVVRLRPVAGSTPPRFEVAEVINLQQVRDEARLRR
jgi:hypothetical protein